MGIFDGVVRGYILDPSWYAGPNMEYKDVFTVQIFGLFVLGAVWFVVLTFFYWAAEQLSYKLFPHYSKMSTIEKTDWTSRIVATFMILTSIYLSILLKLEGDQSTLQPKKINGETEYLLSKHANPETLYILYHAYAMLLGYEIYDLKNCIKLKMTSGVIHHAVLILMFPLGWSTPYMAAPGFYMTTLSYCSNLPAHLRSFLLHTGFRETALYRHNKWAWWVAYIVFRLFGIPWFSANIYFCMPVILDQTALFPVVWYFSSMVVHYMLSLYWFVNMSRTMFPPKDYDLKRVESFGALPKPKTDGGQKFD
jgi:hypothetical protein